MGLRPRPASAGTRSNRGVWFDHSSAQSGFLGTQSQRERGVSTNHSRGDGILLLAAGALLLEALTFWSSKCTNSLSEPVLYVVLRFIPGSPA